MNLFPLHRDEIVGQLLRMLGIFILVPCNAFFTSKNIGLGWFLLGTIIGWIIYDMGLSFVIERQYLERLRKGLPKEVSNKLPN